MSVFFPIEASDSTLTTRLYRKSIVTGTSDSAWSIYKGVRATGSGAYSRTEHNGFRCKLVYDGINRLFFQKYGNTYNPNEFSNSLYFENTLGIQPENFDFEYDLSLRNAFDKNPLLDFFPTQEGSWITVLSLTKRRQSTRINPGSLSLTLYTGSTPGPVLKDAEGIVYVNGDLLRPVGYVLYSYGTVILVDSKLEAETGYYFPAAPMAFDDTVNLEVGYAAQTVPVLANDFTDPHTQPQSGSLFVCANPVGTGISGILTNSASFGLPTGFNTGSYQIQYRFQDGLGQTSNCANLTMNVYDTCSFTVTGSYQGQVILSKPCLSNVCDIDIQRLTGHRAQCNMVPLFARVALEKTGDRNNGVNEYRYRFSSNVPVDWSVSVDGGVSFQLVATDRSEISGWTELFNNFDATESRFKNRYQFILRIKRGNSYADYYGFFNPVDETEYTFREITQYLIDESLGADCYFNVYDVVSPGCDVRTATFTTTGNVKVVTLNPTRFALFGDRGTFTVTADTICCGICRRTYYLNGTLFPSKTCEPSTTRLRTLSTTVNNNYLIFADVPTRYQTTDLRWTISGGQLLRQDGWMIEVQVDPGRTARVQYESATICEVSNEWVDLVHRSDPIQSETPTTTDTTGTPGGPNRFEETDLELTMDAQSTLIVNGQSTILNVIVYNRGRYIIRNVEVRVQLPPQVTLQKSSVNYTSLGSGQYMLSFPVVYPQEYTYAGLTIGVQGTLNDVYSVRGEIYRLDGIDWDSIPGNGFDRGEDDDYTINFIVVSPDYDEATYFNPIILDCPLSGFVCDGDNANEGRIIIQAQNPATLSPLDLEYSFFGDDDAKYQKSNVSPYLPSGLYRVWVRNKVKPQYKKSIMIRLNCGEENCQPRYKIGGSFIVRIDENESTNPCGLSIVNIDEDYSTLSEATLLKLTIFSSTSNMSPFAVYVYQDGILLNYIHSVNVESGGLISVPIGKSITGIISVRLYSRYEDCFVVKNYNVLNLNQSTTTNLPKLAVPQITRVELFAGPDGDSDAFIFGTGTPGARISEVYYQNPNGFSQSQTVFAPISANGTWFILDKQAVAFKQIRVKQAQTGFTTSEYSNLVTYNSNRNCNLTITGRTEDCVIDSTRNTLQLSLSYTGTLSPFNAFLYSSDGTTLLATGSNLIHVPGQPLDFKISRNITGSAIIRLTPTGSAGSPCYAYSNVNLIGCNTPCTLQITNVTPYNSEGTIHSANLTGVSPGVRNYYFRLRNSLGTVISERNVDNVGVPFILFSNGFDNISFNGTYTVEVYDRAVPTCVATHSFEITNLTNSTTTTTAPPNTLPTAPPITNQIFWRTFDGPNQNAVQPIIGRNVTGIGFSLLWYELQNSQGQLTISNVLSVLEYCKNQGKKVVIDVFMLRRANTNGQPQDYANFFPESDIMRHQDGTYYRWLDIVGVQDISPSFSSVPGITAFANFMRDFAQALSTYYVNGTLLAISPITGESGESVYPYRYETQKMTDFSAVALTGFRNWLQTKYTNIGALNTAWGSSHANFSNIGWPVGDPEFGIDTEAKRDWMRWRFRTLADVLTQIKENIQSVSRIPVYAMIPGIGGGFQHNIANGYTNIQVFKNLDAFYTSAGGHPGDHYKKLADIDTFAGTFGPGKIYMTELDTDDLSTNGNGPSANFAAADAVYTFGKKVFNRGAPWLFISSIGGWNWGAVDPYINQLYNEFCAPGVNTPRVRSGATNVSYNYTALITTNGDEGYTTFTNNNGNNQLLNIQQVNDFGVTFPNLSTPTTSPPGFGNGTLSIVTRSQPNSTRFTPTPELDGPDNETDQWKLSSIGTFTVPSDLSVQWVDKPDAQTLVTLNQRFDFAVDAQSLTNAGFNAQGKCVIGADIPSGRRVRVAYNNILGRPGSLKWLSGQLVNSSEGNDIVNDVRSYMNDGGFFNDNIASRFGWINFESDAASGVNKTDWENVKKTYMYDPINAWKGTNGFPSNYRLGFTGGEWNSGFGWSTSEDASDSMGYYKFFTWYPAQNRFATYNDDPAWYQELHNKQGLWIRQALGNIEYARVVQNRNRISGYWAPYVETLQGYTDVNGLFQYYLLRPDQAENTPIVFFMAGGKDFIPWNLGPRVGEWKAPSERAIRGMWRLFNHHSEMFTGTQQYVVPQFSLDGGATWITPTNGAGWTDGLQGNVVNNTPWSIFQTSIDSNIPALASRLQVRGVVNAGKLLVFAIDPWQTNPNTTLDIRIKYATVTDSVRLYGRNLYLGKATM